MGEPHPATSESLLGRTLAGKYEIVSLLGRGGMGSVYKARQPALKRSVAIKVLGTQHANDKTYVARFKREALAACRLDHPNLMRVLDVGEEPDGLLYMVMELIDGKNLARIIAEGVIPSARVVDIMSQTLAAVAVAHEAGVLHRDLKPENIMVVRARDDEGHDVDLVKVCDFGIAKLVPTESGAQQNEQGGTFTATLTATGALVGTPEYMSPEQARGDGIDARSDIYALGMILYEMLAGRVPFSSSNSMKVLLQHASEEPPSPLKYNPKADPRLVTVCLQAIEKDRDDRFATAREMRSSLRADRGLPESTVAIPAPPLSSMPPPSHGSVSGVVNARHDKGSPTVESMPVIPTEAHPTMVSGPPAALARASSSPPSLSTSTPTLANKPAPKSPVTMILVAVIVVLLMVVAFLARR